MERLDEIEINFRFFDVVKVFVWIFFVDFKYCYMGLGIFKMMILMVFLLKVTRFG